MKTYEQIQAENLYKIEKDLSLTNDLLKDIAKTARETRNLLYRLKIQLEKESKEEDK